MLGVMFGVGFLAGAASIFFCMCLTLIQKKDPTRGEEEIRKGDR